MKKFFGFVFVAFIAFSFFSCNKDNPTPDNSNNSGEFNTYAEIESYCIENGWSECNLVNSNDFLTDVPNAMYLCYHYNGTLDRGLSGYSYGTVYKLYTSFSSLLSISTPPTDGFVPSFTCDDEKYGICKCFSEVAGSNPTQYAHRGYAKFFIKRMDESKIKVFYKKCGWPLE